MSTYRSNYVPWTKPSLTPTYTSTKTDTTKSKYDTNSISRPSSRAENKIEPDKSSTSSSKISSSYRPTSYVSSTTRDRSASRDRSKYGALSSTTKEIEKPSSALREKYTIPDKTTATSSGSGTSVRDKYSSSTGTYPGRSDLTRIKSSLDKKESQPPPVTYRTLGRTGTGTSTSSRSRDPSPAEREKTENYRLYSRPYTRSTSREPDPVTTSSLKYGSRAGSKEDLTSIASRYGSRTSRADTKDEIPRLRSSSISSRDDIGSTLSKYTSSRHNSKEDLTTPSSKYITSRFLPKNSVEKSYTAYSKPSSSIEEKRRSRDNLLQVLQSRASTKSPVQTHKEEKSNSPVTITKSPITTTKSPVPTKSPTTVKAPQNVSKKEEKVSSEESTEETDESEDEMETVTVITRGTSPTPPSNSTFVRTRRADMARILQKDIQRPKKRNMDKMIDKEMQSDRLDDTARYSRFGSSTISAAPWSSYLDLKYNSPRSNYTPSTTSPRFSNSSSYNYKSKESSPVSLSNSQSKGDQIESRSRENSVGLVETDISLSEKSVSEKKSIDKSVSENTSSNKLEKNPSLKSTKKSNSDRSSSESINSLSRNNSTKSISKPKTKESKSTKSSVSSSSESKSKSSANKTSIESKSPTPLSTSSPLSKLSVEKSPTPLSSSTNSNSIPSIPKLSIENSKSTPSVITSLESSSKSKISSKEANKKQLPPQVPKNESITKASSASNIQNKDFRKSVLNMNTDGKLVKKTTKRSNSLNSASSDSEQSSAANCTEKQINDLPSLSNSTSQSLVKAKSSNSLSKLPQFQRVSSIKDKDSENRRSPSVSSESGSSTISSSEDDQKAKSQKKKLSANSSRTSMLLSSADELSVDRPAKPPPSPRLKTEGPKTEAEAKSFLMRALAPVTNFFKGKETPIESSDNSENFKTATQSDDKKKSLLKHVESGELAWWLKENAEVQEGVQKFPTPHDSDKESGKVKFKFEKHNSGEEPWWLNESCDVPEGVQKLASNGSEIEVKDGKHIYKIRRNESGKVEWWLDSSSSGNETSKSEKNKKGFTSENLKIRHIDSGERAWWLKSNENIAETKDAEEKEEKKLHQLRHQDSGEKAWWLMSQPNIPQGVKILNENSSDSEDDDQAKLDEPLGDRASPEGLEMPENDSISGRLSPYDNVPSNEKPKRPNNIPLFISRHTNIDEILGGGHQMLSPLMDRIFSFREKNDDDCEEVDVNQVRIHDSTAQRPTIQPNRIDVIKGYPGATSGYGKLDDAALQLYKDGDYGSYLDLEASISEQQEEFDGFQTNKKNSIVLRTQLSVRVHTIIEKLLTSEGRELRRALFSLKQIFQEDKDLVHEFVQNDGLACLIKVGSEADQNYQNYILRALGQVMLYVDGMNGVMEHNQTVQWLYTLIASKFRLVVKTALKLLLVFVEYTDSNCMLLIKAVNAVDGSQGLMAWTNIMRLLKDFNSADTELLIYAMTLVNKCLNGIPDQDTYYDQTDALEEQGIEGIIQRYMSKQGTDLDLLQQFQIYEAVLQHEDGEDKGMPLRHLDESIRKTLRSRKSVVDNQERRKSRRHSTGNTPVNVINGNKTKFYSLQANSLDDEDESSSSQGSGHNDHNLNGSYKENNKANDVGVTPALRRRRERAERQRSFMREQQETAAMLRASLGIAPEDAENGNYTNNLQQRLTNGNLQLSRNSSRKDLTPLMNAVNKLDSTEDGLIKKPWVLQMVYGNNEENTEDNNDTTNENERKMLIQLKRENTVKDITQKLANQNILHSPSEDNKINRIGDMSGLISKAKEGLAKSKSKADILKSPTNENVPKIIEIKKSENELRWEELVHTMNRPLNLCDLDFTDLASDDEVDILAPAATTNGIPPPPPPLSNDMAPPPPPIGNRNPPPFPPTSCFGVNLTRPQRPCQEPAKTNTIKKNKKTVKLFWKEVRDEPIALSKLQKCGGMIWDELNPVSIDTQKLEHLFESRAKDLISKEKQQEMNKNKEIIVLDHKRSNAINIGMTKLPPPRSIKTAILKMDATIMNREGIEKLLTMLPTEEERTKIQDAQSTNPDLPLGSAEQFLLTLASISELPARLKLWAFKLDFENLEREIAEPLMDLKQGLELLKVNKTFRGILSTLLSIGIFLNGNEVKGFQIEYLAKVPEVKDTVHKHSLLHHLCHIVMEKFPEATDLYSEIGAITRASKIDFDELGLNIQRLEADCKASWDHLKLIAKHDGSTMMKVKMSDFLADCAERIILLEIVHRRVMNRYHKFLLWLGIPLHRVADTKPNEFCRVVSEFALEYRTTRERVLQQLEKKANHRERNKTRGKMITEVGKFRTKEDRADAELRQLLGSDISDVESMQGTLPWRRQKSLNNTLLRVPNGNITDDGDDEILESLVKTATKAPTSRATPRERKRTRHADRKSLKRSRTRENNPFGSRDSP